MIQSKITYNQTVKEAMALALFQLLKTKTITQISISDIVETAGVARSSYYRNYNTKEEILCDYIQTLYKNYFLEHDLSPSRLSMNDFLIHRFQFIRNYKDFFIILKNQNLLYYLFETLDPELSTLLCGMKLHSEYYQVFFSSCSAGIIRQWIDNNFKETEEDMATILLNISHLLTKGAIQ